MKLGNANPYVIDFDPFTVLGPTASPSQEVGASLNISDGRIFRYANSGAFAQSAGKLNTAPIQKPNHQNIAVVSSTAVGASPSQVTVTLGATASVVEEYVDGFLSVGLTPGQGHVYKISDQPATAASGNQTVTLFDPIQVQLSSASKASLVHNTWNGTVETTTQTLRAGGVPMTPVPASVTNVSDYYYWDQTRGIASTLNDQAIALGSWLTVSASVAGAVIAMSGTYATALLTPKVGEMTVKVGVDTQYEPVFLTID